jgi:hypothetical protein
LAEVDIEVPKDTSLFNAYLWNGQTLNGEPLEETIHSGEIGISGKQGRDWWFHTDEHDVPIGVIFPINADPESRLWYPRGGNRLRISPDKRVNFRKEVKATATSFADQMPPPDAPVLWLGKTSHLHLSPRVHVKIPTTVPNARSVQELQLANTDGEIGQQNSPLLTGGRTNWPPVVEVFSPTAGDVIPQTIFYSFVRAAKLRRKNKL